MIDDALVLRVERLRDTADQLRAELKKRYASSGRPVVSTTMREAAAELGERWLVEIAARDDVLNVLGQEVLATLNVLFQRLITLSEQQSKRGRFDSVLKSIVKDFRTVVIVPLKQARNRSSGSVSLPTPQPQSTQGVSVFVGQSFAPNDAVVNDVVAEVLRAFDLVVVTGEKPKGDSVSKKVRERIEAADLFVGIFTRRERIRGKQEWTTSSWVIDEKAYALANRKKMILLREVGVQSIGGIQGDYEFIEFSRDEPLGLVSGLIHTIRSLV